MLGRELGTASVIVVVVVVVIVVGVVVVVVVVVWVNLGRARAKVDLNPLSFCWSHIIDSMFNTRLAYHFHLFYRSYLSQDRCCSSTTITMAVLTNNNIKILKFCYLLFQPRITSIEILTSVLCFSLTKVLKSGFSI